VIKLDFHHPRKKKERKANLMIIAFITSNSSLVPALEGLCSSNPYRFVTERAYGPLVPYLPACGGTSTIGRYVPYPITQILMNLNFIYPQTRVLNYF